MNKPSKCDVCGRFVSPAGDDGGTRRLITPDSDYSSEEWETLCARHEAQEAPAQAPAAPYSPQNPKTP